MRAHVADVLRREARVLERGGHRDAGARTGLVRIGQMRGVATRAVARQLGVDARPARQRVLTLLEREHARALADHEPVALGVEGAAGALGAVTQRRERAQVAVAREHHGRDRRVGPAREHRVGAARADQPERDADCIRTGSARGAGRRRRAAQLQRARHRGAGRVGERERNEERADPIRATLEVGSVCLVERAHAAVGRADARAHALGREAEIARIRERELCGSCGQLRATVHAARVAAAEERLAVEVLDAADRGRRLAVQLEHAGPRNAVCKGVPEPIDAHADRAHDPHPGDHDPPAHGLESARCAARVCPVPGYRRPWVYAGTNDRKVTGVSSVVGAIAPAESSSNYPHVDRSPQTARRPPARSG